MTGPAPEVAAQRLAVRAALADLAPGDLVLVACSGGADSLALAAATGFVAPRAGLRAGAVVVDHGLLAGSDRVAAQAAEQCRALGLDPVDVVRVTVPTGAGTGGPEAAARDARHTALAHAAARHGAVVLLLGHTLDDQAESVLLGLARGSGARSLAGMAAERGLLRRPFLGVRRTATVAACRALGLTPWDDPSNDGGEDAPRRSRVRHEVLPVLDDVLGPGVVPALARTAEQLREDADALEAFAEDLLARARRAAVVGDGRVDAPAGHGTGVDVTADVATLLAAPAAVRRRALRDACVLAGAPAGSLHRSHVLAVDALLLDWHGQGPVALAGGGEVRRGCGRLTFATTARDGEQ